jgi:hypothetical protein
MSDEDILKLADRMGIRRTVSAARVIEFVRACLLANGNLHRSVGLGS